VFLILKIVFYPLPFGRRLAQLINSTRILIGTDRQVGRVESKATVDQSSTVHHLSSHKLSVKGLRRCSDEAVPSVFACLPMSHLGCTCSLSFLCLDCRRQSSCLPLPCLTPFGPSVSFTVLGRSQSQFERLFKRRVNSFVSLNCFVRANQQQCHVLPI
jgi:hypothetical protein